MKKVKSYNKDLSYDNWKIVNCDMCTNKLSCKLYEEVEKNDRTGWMNYEAAEKIGCVNVDSETVHLDSFCKKFK